MAGDLSWSQMTDTEGLAYIDIQYAIQHKDSIKRNNNSVGTGRQSTVQYYKVHHLAKSPLPGQFVRTTDSPQPRLSHLIRDSRVAGDHVYMTSHPRGLQ